MRYARWARARKGRLVVVLGTIFVYFLLLTVDASRYFSHIIEKPSMFLASGVGFGFSAFTALIFLTTGCLVWLYAGDRWVAFFLFCFSFFATVTFTVETGAISNDPLLAGIGNAGSSLVVLAFAILLLYFPRNYLSSNLYPAKKEFIVRRLSFSTLLLRGYLGVLVLLGISSALPAPIRHLLPLQLHLLIEDFSNFYFLFALTGILATIFVTYRLASSLRERQQLRLLLVGVILAFAPFLLLTVVPLILNLPQYSIDGQFSTITAVLLPLALGYSILRYQFFLFDTYVRRAVAWMAGIVSIFVLGYLVYMFGRVLFPDTIDEIVIVSTMGILVPIIWWLARVMAERLFFNEAAHYRRLIDEPNLLARETLDLNEASQLLTQAAINVFEIPAVALFVLDEDTGYYRPVPSLEKDDLRDASRLHLVDYFLQEVKPSSYQGNDSIDYYDPIIQRMASSKRPLLLSEAIDGNTNNSFGMSRYLITSSPDKAHYLLAAVRTQGKLIGILLLGERGDHQQYGGPDFEAIELIVSRFSSVLETARLYDQASRQVAILNSLYSATTELGKAFQSIEEVGIAYATVAANALLAGAEVWLYDQNESALQLIVYAGSGPRLMSQESLTRLQEDDWSSWFYEGDSAQVRNHLSVGAPQCLPQKPHFPFAWIPLQKGRKYLGLLVLTYPRPHLFSQEEKRVLGMFASQCASTLENTQITLELREAYEHQKELDRLKDQFIITASHELRTPLTAVQGYIELLNEYNTVLSPEARAKFIAKAHRGCDELVLMVGNIMDASHVNIDAENIRLTPTQLAESIYHILEILEGVTRRENRLMRGEVPEHLHVMADDLRLRQVLLNLVSNALKYSPAGTTVEITAHSDEKEVTVRIRDYGLGIPAEDRDRLFRRFVRLERDMNSPVRGAGLGLYICKQLIEAMRGRIWVESSGVPGEGSIFAFTLTRAESPTCDSKQDVLLKQQEV